MTMDQRLVGDVLRQCRLAHTVRADQDDIGGVVEELERHEGLDGAAVAAFGPVPVEVTERLEAADMSGFHPTFQAATRALVLLPGEERRQPFGAGDL